MTIFANYSLIWKLYERNIIIPSKVKHPQHANTHIAWLGIREHFILVHCCLVDEIWKGSLLPTEQLLFGNGRGGIYFVVPSQASWLLGLGYISWIETDGPLMMSFLSHSSHFIQEIANHKSIPLCSEIYLIIYLPLSLYSIFMDWSFLKSTLYLLYL